MQLKVVLHQFPHPPYLPNFSPFCMKLETFLRMANIKYSVKEVMNPGKAPKRKLPFIKIDGKPIADSSLIIDYLQENSQYNIDHHLTPTHKALGMAIQRLCEDHLYWGIVYSRWQDPVGFNLHWRLMMASKLPRPLRFIIHIIRRKAVKSLYEQGTGRHDSVEIYQSCSKDIEALNEFLSEATPYLFGEQPSSFDASVYGVLGSLFFTPWDFPLKTAAQQYPSLKQYYNYLTEQYFSNFPKVE